MSSIAPRLELRQGQSLVMTQQLQQSIKLLQLSSQELAEYIDQEMEKNPLLAAEEQEPAEKPEENATEEGQEQQSETAAPEEANEPAAADASESAEEWSEPQESQSAEDDMHESRYEKRGAGGSFSGEDEDGNALESFAAKQVSLREHLLDQLGVEVSDPVQRTIGQHLIDLVDESGYIKEDTTNLASTLGVDPETIESTFALLHSFDPVGVCARTLQECLAIQLRDKDRLDPAMEKLLTHLDLVAKGDAEALRKLCGVDAEDVREMCAEIRALNPRPGSGFQHEPVQAVVPDVFLRRARGGVWHVELNAAVLPRVLVNRRYHSQLSGKTRDKQEKKYLSDQMAAANWLIKALDQRAQTILKVSTEIVAHQDAFFRQGIKYLRPLTLREVAAAVNMHESTVSRVTTNKYISTPRGTYELKYFFSAAIQNASGGEHYSNKTVQFLIGELIGKEDVHSPLSDDALAAALKERGIDIARRTVAKYREQLHIPSSTLRRRKTAS